jgi:hypothetical protein
MDTEDQKRLDEDKKSTRTGIGAGYQQSREREKKRGGIVLFQPRQQVERDWNKLLERRNVQRKKKGWSK